MSRLFVGQRELDLISDLTKEVIKDIVGQKIYYYSISEIKTRVHEIYNESMEKVFENPIIIPALVSSPEHESKKGLFGSDDTYKIEVYIQYRDLVENGINPQEGDFMSYGENFYEVTHAHWIKTIYGHVEQKDGIKLNGNKARESQFKAKILGPTDIRYSDPDAVQTEFRQSKGLEAGDQRALVDNNILEKPTSQPEISPRGDDAGIGSSFYWEVNITRSGSA